MAKTLQQILGAKNLIGVIQGIKGGVPADILPAGFQTVTRTVEGKTCTYRKVSGTRKLARLVHYGAPAVKRQLSGVSEVPVTLMHSYESHTHDPATLMNLTNLADEGRQALGIAEISRQTAEFRTLFDNLRMASIYSALCQGAIYFDGNGDMLPNATGAVTTINYAVPAGNQGRVGGIITAAWDVAATRIATHIRNLKTYARRLTGYPLKHAFYGSAILDFLLANTSIISLLVGNSTLQAAMQSGEIPDGFLGLNWHPIDEAFYEDAAGTAQGFAAADLVVLTPDPTPDWWEVIQGTYPVPRDLGNVSADPVQAVANIDVAPGMFSYAVVSHNPVGIEQFGGDTFLPALKVPSAIFQLRVDF